ncbi:hypothetical protein [Streptomyces klenkii]
MKGDAERGQAVADLEKARNQAAADLKASQDAARRLAETVARTST